MKATMMPAVTMLAVLSAAAVPCARAAEAVTGTSNAGWNVAGAAGYLDERAAWWMSWPPAARDKGTFCVSCHTALPYALSRGALRGRLGETGAAPAESKLVENVAKRVRMWSEIAPVYSDEKQGAPKTAEARGTEAVLNALILTSEDARAGKLSADARLALDNMWALQTTSGETRGAWTWLNFHNEPWEADDSQYWGAALAALAVGTAPEEYAMEPANRERVAMMVEYLRAKAPGQSLLNRVWVMWAAAKLPALATASEQKAWAEELYARQRDDGGWSASSLVVSTWKRRDGTSMDTVSDGYATALAAVALEQSGVGRAEPRLAKALAWLEKNQDAKGGGWPAMSLNKQRDPASDVGRFMRDAATGYSVLALTGGE